ncbi:MAG: D-xylose 1-dehydrogenase Gfo6, partial [Halobacteriales archaeon]|nr:D-xylose 1-dehydrogenase Gfo6 [Halobacteriales archaeon]
MADPDPLRLDDGYERDWETTDATAVEPVRFALVGCGWFTQNWVTPALKRSDRCVPAVFVSGDEEKAERLAEETAGGDQGITYDEFHEGLAREAYDAVYIATPNALHLPFVETAATFGAPVICEKPLERSSDRARQLVRVCETADVPLMTAYRMHTEPAVRRARSAIAAGLIGDPVEVYGSLSFPMFDVIDPSPTQWRLDRDLAGGGACWDVGVYPIETTRVLLDADPVAATGRLRSVDDRFDSVDERASFALDFPGDVQMTGFASQNAFRSTMVRVVGTEGTLRIEPAFQLNRNPTVTVETSAGRTSVQFENTDQLMEEFDYFADRVRSGAPIHADGHHGLVDLLTLEAIRTGSETGEWVSVGD